MKHDATDPSTAGDLDISLAGHQSDDPDGAGEHGYDPGADSVRRAFARRPVADSFRDRLADALADRDADAATVRAARRARVLWAVRRVAVLRGGTPGHARPAVGGAGAARVVRLGGPRRAAATPPLIWIAP